MITLVSTSNKPKIPDADYVLDKVDKFFDIISVLTPKFEGKWLIVLLDPKIKFIKELLDTHSVPDWVDVQIFIANKKIEEVCLEFPEVQPSKKSKRDLFDELLAGLHNVVDPKAIKALYNAFVANPNETESTLKRLDKDCKSGSIPLKQIQSNFIVNKRVYASEVINAFLMNDPNRWSKYNFMVKEIGQEIAYYAMYNYVKKLLIAKRDYLMNKDTDVFIVNRVDAPVICFAYTLFANSSNYNQLRVILYALENRSQESLTMLQS
jgi:hypothetical protein